MLKRFGHLSLSFQMYIDDTDRDENDKCLGQFSRYDEIAPTSFLPHGCGITPQVRVRQRLLPEPVSVVLPLEYLQRGSARGADARVRVLRLQVSRGVLPRV